MRVVCAVRPPVPPMGIPPRGSVFLVPVLPGLHCYRHYLLPVVPQVTNGLEGVTGLPGDTAGYQKTRKSNWATRVNRN